MNKRTFNKRKGQDAWRLDPLSSGLALDGNQGNKIITQHLVPSSPLTATSGVFLSSTVNQTRLDCFQVKYQHCSQSCVRRFWPYRDRCPDEHGSPVEACYGTRLAETWDMTYCRLISPVLALEPTWIGEPSTLFVDTKRGKGSKYVWNKGN